MSDFKGRHFGGEIVLWAAVRWCRFRGKSPANSGMISPAIPILISLGVPR